MDFSLVIMWSGFILAAYSVVGNDVIQTLGTFLSSNEHRKWYVLWAFAAIVLCITLIYSWVEYGGEVSYQRLIGDPPKYSLENPKYPLPDPYQWYFILPPLVLMLITRMGIPVSTSFLILTFFKPKGLDSMLVKSVWGYIVAFSVAILVYFMVSKVLEKRFVDHPIKAREKQIWTVLQWCSTGFLWTMWLIQDFANIYVYLPRQLDVLELLISMFILVAMLGYIFYVRGGAIQSIVKAKSNTQDIRSATIIDFIYGLVLLYFKELNNVPMSTTWVFIGLLSGREIALRISVYGGMSKVVLKDISKDLAKVFLGLIVSILLVFFIKWTQGENIMEVASSIIEGLINYDYGALLQMN